jgi:heme-degrading monooxygenase HmoA
MGSVGVSRALLYAGESSSGGSSATARKGPIVLYCDLKVDPKREQEMLDRFHREFKPAAEKFDGYVDLKLLKIRKVMQGEAPAPGINYRFQLTFESEEKRQIWIASDVHSRVWPRMEEFLTDKGYIVLLTDSM